MDDPRDIYRAKVNLETAQIAWKELQHFFAKGTTIHVHDELDLVEVAFQMSEDNAAQVQQWMRLGKLNRVTDKEASAWLDSDMLVWAVVVSPWVLVQPAGMLQ